MTRLNYLLHQYYTLNVVAKVLSELAGTPAPASLKDTGVRKQLDQQSALIMRGELDGPRRALGQIGGELYGVQEQLHEFDSQISVFQIRTRFQQSEADREEIGALLQFMLSKMQFMEGDLDKIDYLTTRFYALSIKAGKGFSFENKVLQEYQKMLDYAGIAKTDAPDPEGMESLDFFKEELSSATSFRQLTLNDTLDRLRTFKAGLNNRRLHPEVMVELARVNLLAGERFEQLAAQEKQHIDKMAAELISAGVNEVEQPQGTGTVAIDDVRKISLLDATLLNEDYKHNRQRMERLADVNDTLARAHERLGLEDSFAEESAHADEPEMIRSHVSPADTPETVDFPALPTTEPEAVQFGERKDSEPEALWFQTAAVSAPGNNHSQTARISQPEATYPLFPFVQLNKPDTSHSPSEQISRPENNHAEQIIQPAEPDNLNRTERTLTPEQFQRELCARLQQIAVRLREHPAVNEAPLAEIELLFDHSAIRLDPWETSAFQQNYPGLRMGETSLGSLLRVSVALMTELREKQELLCQGIASPEFRNGSLNSANYLEHFGRQMLSEFEAFSHSDDDSLPSDFCQQFQHTQRKLAGICALFSARIQEATGS